MCKYILFVFVSHVGDSRGPEVDDDVVAVVEGAHHVRRLATGWEVITHSKNWPRMRKRDCSRGSPSLLRKKNNEDEREWRGCS
jgi:hypothetical protein